MESKTLCVRRNISALKKYSISFHPWTHPISDQTLQSVSFLLPTTKDVETVNNSPNPESYGHVCSLITIPYHYFLS